MDAPIRWLTIDEINTYHRDGAICARQIMPLRWVERMAAAVDRIIAASGPIGRQLSKQDSGFTHDLYMYTSNVDFRAFVFESPAVHKSLPQMANFSPKKKHCKCDVFS